MTEIKRRILTLQVEIIDKHEAGWIWYGHLDNGYQYGVRVKVIREGPICESCIEHIPEVRKMVYERSSGQCSDVEFDAVMGPGTIEWPE